jgi:hypothetical protein
VFVLLSNCLDWLYAYMLERWVEIKDQYRRPQYSSGAVYRFTLGSCQKCCAGNTTKWVVVEMHRAPHRSTAEAPCPIVLASWRPTPCRGTTNSSPVDDDRRVHQLERIRAYLCDTPARSPDRVLHLHPPARPRSAPGTHEH